MALTDICVASGQRVSMQFNIGYSGSLTDIDLYYKAGKPSFAMNRGNTGTLVDGDIVGRKIIMEFPPASGGSIIYIQKANFAH